MGRLYNNGASAVDISGYKMYDKDGPADTNAIHTFGSVTIPAGDYLLCCYIDGTVVNPKTRVPRTEERGETQLPH